MYAIPLINHGSLIKYLMDDSVIGRATHYQGTLVHAGTAD